MKKLQLFISCLLLGISLSQCDNLEVSDSKIALSEDKDFQEYSKSTDQAYSIIEAQIAKLSPNELAHIDNLLLDRKNLTLDEFEVALGLNEKQLSNISVKQSRNLEGFIRKFNINTNSSSTQLVKEAFVLLDGTTRASREDPCKVADNNCRQDGATKAAIGMAGCAFSGPAAGVCAGIVAANALYDLYACARNYQNCIGNGNKD